MNIISYFNPFPSSIFSKLHEMALQHELTSSKLQDSMRKMAGDFNSTLTNLQKVQTENHTLERQLSSRQVELDGVREEVREKVRLLEEEQAVARRRNKDLAELEQSMSIMRDVSGCGCYYGNHSLPYKELDGLGMTNSGIRNSTLLSQVCPVHSYNECTQLSSPQTHQGLRDRLAILQQQLDNSLSLTDDNGPTTSHSLSQLGDIYTVSSHSSC